ncbi:hypothetical protein FRUB_02804 [Fimbriiglobus ruber]|uniref:SD-repeat containing protein B domain-containing protein n=1 Tax=Fimbriiglobus ruber TaxID=1908690 RepID=A0A225E3E9_9BACT|nr:hypothetical protein FRUB_02804 [Fimbriiglobus ruber]
MTPPAGYASSTGTNGSPTGPYEPGATNDTDSGDGLDHGTQTGATVTSTPVTLTPSGTDPDTGPNGPGTANNNVSLGLYQPQSLGSTIWDDTNNDGVQEPGEPGIPGVQVVLLDSSGNPVATTTTDASGHYQFNNLAPGAYTVQATPPAGMISSTGTNGSPTGPAEPGSTNYTNTGSDLDHGTQTGATVTSQPVILGQPGTNPDAGPSGPGTANTNVNLGLFTPVSIDSTVWDDTNNDGVQEPGEPGIPGATVVLLDASGNPVATTTTDASGNYQFNDLTPGTYSVQVTPPAGYASSTGTNGSPTGPAEPGSTNYTDSGNGLDHGTQTGTTVTSQPVTLTPPGTDPDAGPNGPGTANTNVDLGLYQPLSLGSTVWDDTNNDGVQEPGEPGIPGATVVLLDASGNPVATTTTDASGHYQFNNLLPGTYSVQVTPPAGYASSTGTNGSPTGPYEPGSTNDTDSGDGLDHGTQTGATVTSTPVTLTTSGTDPDAGPNGPGTANNNVSLGLYQPQSLGSTIWDDTNNDGVQEPGEPGIPGVQVVLLDSSGNPVATTTTDANGHYQFNNLAPGTYTVQATPPAGMISSTGTPGSPTGPAEPGSTNYTNTGSDLDHGTQTGATVTSTPVTLGQPGTNPDTGPSGPGTANTNVNLGLFTSQTISSTVWDDKNNDGVQQPGEPGIPGATVVLLDGSGNPIATTTTDANGHYTFTDLPPGTYQVQVTPPPGYASSTGTNGSPTGPAEPGSTNYTDSGNGLDHGTQTGTTVTSQPLTLGLPGTNPDTGPNGPGTANDNPTIGLYQPLSLGSTVWDDTNNDGVQEPGEPGIPGATVVLLDSSGNPVATTTTDANGHYQFNNLIPGTYTVQVTPPAGMISSTGQPGSPTGPAEPGSTNYTDAGTDLDHGTQTGATVTSTPVTLTASGTDPDAGPNGPGTANNNVNLGLFTPLSINATVWDDTNNDGVQEPGEPVLPGVTVTLFNSSGTPIATTTTDANGNYQFTDLPPGTYTVQVSLPPGYVSSSVTGPNEGQNHGATSGQFATSTVTLGPPGSPTNPGNNGLSNNNQDFGLVSSGGVSGNVYRDQNADGKDDGGDTGLGGVVVTLTGTDQAGRPVSVTTTTDASGAYSFPNLPPGTYTLTESPPNGYYLAGIDNPGTLGSGNPGPRQLTVTVGPSQTGQNYNFGEIAPGAATGYVYVDANGNGVMDPGEQGLGGVPVTISGIAFPGTPEAHTLTAADVPGGLTAITLSSGQYYFPDLPPGNYTFTMGQIPAGYVAGSEQIGDPSLTGVTVTPGAIANVTVPTSQVGPLNFGVLPVDMSKREFLSATPIPVTGMTTTAANTGPTSPAFTTTTGDPSKPVYVAVAAGPGGPPTVRVFDYATGAEVFRFDAYEPTYTGGVRVAIGDVNGDGIPDIVTATGVGGGPRIRVFSGKDGSLLEDFFAYEPTFTGGLFVAVGDINGDGHDDIIVGTDTGGGPRIRVFSGTTGAVLEDFYAFDPSQRGGVRVAVGNFNGHEDIVATTGPGVPTRIRVFDGTTLAVLADYSPFEAGFTGGVNIAVGDFNGDGTPDVIVGAEAGGGPRVQVFSGLTTNTLANFFAFDPSFTGGVRVAAQDVNGDGKADLILGAGPGGAPRVQILSATGLQSIDNFYAFDTNLVGGVYVG